MLVDTERRKNWITLHRVTRKIKRLITHRTNFKMAPLSLGILAMNFWRISSTAEGAGDVLLEYCRKRKPPSNRVIARPEDTERAIDLEGTAHKEKKSIREQIPNPVGIAAARRNRGFQRRGMRRSKSARVK